MTITVSAPPRHGSSPSPATAPALLLKIVDRIRSELAEPEVPASTHQLLSDVAAESGFWERLVSTWPWLLDRLTPCTVAKKPYASALVTNTINIVRLKASGTGSNVVPARASARLDIRLLPGRTPLWAKYRIESIVDAVLKEDCPAQEGPCRVDYDSFGEATSLSNDDDAARAEFDALARHAVRDTDDIVGPLVSPGYTDSIRLRRENVPALGFVPFRLTQEEAATQHGIDERVSRDNVVGGLQILTSAVIDVSEAPPN
jgi:acetylornithine deacetylase/succinyl-diaminopimelate desuccinylase-like protein